MSRRHEAIPLDVRISQAFVNGATADTVAELLAETDSATQAAAETVERVHARALDPTLPSRDAAAIRGEADSASFNFERLQAALIQLKTRLDALRVAEEDARRQAAYEKAEAERDLLSKELAELYPGFATKLSDLLSRVEASNHEIEYLNIHALPTGAQPLLSAELVARQMEGWTVNGLDAPRLTSSVRLPAFERTPHAPWLWPRARPESNVMLKALFEQQAEAKKAAKEPEPADASVVETAL
jgi:hypothetical protein